MVLDSDEVSCEVVQHQDLAQRCGCAMASTRHTRHTLDTGKLILNRVNSNIVEL